MQNRVPTYPNRVRLTQVSGDIYDLTRADEPTEVGTPLNKETLLSDDAVSALTGAGLTLGDDTPSEAFEAIAGVIGNNDRGAQAEVVSYTGTGNYGASNPCSVTFSFKPDIIWLFAFMNGSGVINDFYAASLYRTYAKRAIIPVSTLTNTYTEDRGLFQNDSGRTYGKFDDLTNTYSWYGVKGADTQLNQSGFVYYLIGIKGV